MAEAFLEGQSAEGLPEAAEGDMEGVEIGGIGKKPVLTDGQKVKLAYHHRAWTWCTGASSIKPSPRTSCPGSGLCH